MARIYNPTLDGIRGLAIIGVLLTHATSIFVHHGFSGWFIRPMIAGWAGVDLFFVLSGFLITGILLDTKAATNRARSFYARRVLRIFPVYYLTLVLFFCAASFFPDVALLAAVRSWPDRLMFLSYLQNWLVLKNPAYFVESAVGHFWSLAVEEQFYLIWPWIVWSISTKLLLKITIAGAAASLLLRVYLVAHFGVHFWIHVLTVTRGEGLLVGSALAIVAATRECIPKRYLLRMAYAGFAILLFILVRDRWEFIDTDAGPYMYTIGVSGLALVFGALVGSSSYFVAGLTPFLNRPWLRSFGKYSYGLYIYHLPIYISINAALQRLGVRFPASFAYSVLITALQIMLTFAVAWASYSFLESKLLGLKKYFEPDYDSAIAFPQKPAALRSGAVS